MKFAHADGSTTTQSTDDDGQTTVVDTDKDGKETSSTDGGSVDDEHQHTLDPAKALLMGLDGARGPADDSDDTPDDEDETDDPND